HPGYRTITTQLYFEGGDYVENDVATAVKPELVLHPEATGDGNHVHYPFVLDKEN
ncbi:MAG: catechol 1,2-dioxygenase, partial [Corynebacterium sp.]|nr:catechol 1,2-dioxygenase [Corynebacterium sp.]